jgi:hypothetical protein
MLRFTFAGFVLCSAVAVPAQAQWLVGLEAGTEAFTGVSRTADAGPERSFRPYRPAWLGVRAESPGSRLRFGASLLFGSPDLALEATDLVVVARDGITTVLGFHPGVMIQVAELRDGVTLRGEAGLILEHWGFTEQAGRLRAGGEIGLSLEVGLGGRFSGALGGHVGVSASPFRPEELPPGFEPRSAWRQGLRGSVRIRLQGG